MSVPRLFLIKKLVAIGVVPFSERSARSVVSAVSVPPLFWMLDATPRSDKVLYVP